MKLNLICILSACILLIACNSKTNKQLIVGGWIPEGDQTNKPRRIIFSEHNTAIATRAGEDPSPEDSIKYQFGDDETTLLTTEKNGKTEKLKIITLTEHEMILFRESRQDTFKLKRE